MLGVHGTREANLAMYEADLVVCVGARFDACVTGRLDAFCPRARLVHIDIDPTSINKTVRADIPVVGDCATMLQHLLLHFAETRDRGRLAPWWKRIDSWRAERSLAFDDTPDAIAPQALMTRLQVALKKHDAIVSTDVGQHQIWAAQHLRFERPMRWLTSGGAGTKGYGLPAAIGAQIAYPARTVVCVSDNASILMNIQELSTAVYNETPVKVVLCSNLDKGMVRRRHELTHGSRSSATRVAAPPDLVAVARGFGWQARRVTERSNLDAALTDCLASETPYFLDVGVSEQENCLSLIPAGHGHHEVMLGKGRAYSE
jgi:acetolactate synthase-1/2/3 large subunit